MPIRARLSALRGRLRSPLRCTRKTTNSSPSSCATAKPALPVTPSNFLLRVDHHDTFHNDWVKINDDGTVTVTVPDDAKRFGLSGYL